MNRIIQIPDFTLPTSKNIKAKLQDTDGFPLEFANVILESNSRIGTTTDQNGNFALENVSYNDTVIISYQGTVLRFKPFEIPQVITMDISNSLDPVTIVAKPKPKPNYLKYGLLGLAVVVVAATIAKPKPKALNV